VTQGPPLSLTVCITVRDERENVEPIVRDLPILTTEQEILFVEGHSRDGTAMEIDRVASAYPTKNVRRITQPGIGQGDAIREGFLAARGECIVLFEGDGTSDPEDIRAFYDALSCGTLDFIEGNRFGFRREPGSMPRLNRIGNWLFAGFLSRAFGLQLSDVLAGIKGIKRSDFLDLCPGWGELGIEDPFGDFELLVGAVRCGLKIGQLPIRYRPRNYGISKTHVVRHGLLLGQMAWRAYKVARLAQTEEERLSARRV
jgi:glycosyltransferase involved in cell wall biosynthesis